MSVLGVSCQVSAMPSQCEVDNVRWTVPVLNSSAVGRVEVLFIGQVGVEWSWGASHTQQ